MASFDEYRKKLNSKYGAKTVKSSEEEVPSTSTSPVTVTSDFTGTPFDEYRQKMNTKYRTDKTDEEGISKWFSDAAKAMQSMHIYNSNNGGRYVPDYGGSDAVRIDELLNSSSDVYNYLLNHKDELDNFDELDKQFSSYRKALMQYDMTNYYTKNYYGQFEDEDSYNAYLKEYERQQTYSGKGYDELKGILGSMDAGEEKDWLTNYTYSVMTIDDYNKAIAEKEAELKAAKSADASRNVQGNSYAMYPTLTAKSSDTKAIEAELERLKNGKWKLENEQKYSGLESNEDYAKYSTQVSEDPTSKLRIGNWDIIGDLAYDYINDIDGTREKQDYSGEGNARGNIDLYKYSFMTDTEIAHYNYLYNVEGKKAANEYLDYLSYDLDERRTQQLASDNAAFATEHPVLSSLYSIPTNLMSGIGMLDVAAQNVVSGVKEAVTGEYTPINYNSWGMSPTVQSTSIRGTVAENLANEYGVIELNREDHPILSRLLNGKSLGDVYQLGMSMADSGTVALLSPIIGGFGTVLLGGAAGSQGVLDAVSRGATDEQALWMGVLNGTFEALFEKVSLDNLLKGNARNIVTAFFKQGFIEGTEELSTSFFNNIADILIMAEKSGYRSNIAAYMAAGLTEEDAAKEALKDAAIEMGWDFIGGVISGGIMGGGQVINTVQQNIDAKRIYGTDIATLINEALGIDPNNALAIKLQSRLDSGKNVSGSQIRNIVEQNESAMLSQDISTIESAAANRLTELGETGNVNAIASALAKQAAGQRITRSERQLISNSTYGQRVANELTPENINSGEYSTAWAENLDTNRINPTEYSRLVEATQITQESSIPTENKVVASVPEMAQEVTDNAAALTIEEASQKYGAQAGAMLHTYIEGQDVEKYDTAYGSAYDMGKEGVKLDYVKKSILTNYLSESQIELAYEAGQAAAKTVDYSSVESIESIKNGKMTLKLNNGNTISSDEVIYASSGDAVLYETVANLGVDAGTANQIIKSYDESIEVTTFAKGIEEAVRYGKTGISMNDLMKNADFANELTETQRDLAYKAGKKLAGKEVARQQNKKTPRNASKAEAKIGNVHYNGDTSKLNDKQRVGYETAVMISKALGIDIYFFESYLKDGTRVYKDTNGNEVKAPNGWYDTNNSSIHIDINAGMSGEGTILFTLSHELTHFIKEWSPRKFKVLANFLFEQFGNTEQSVDNLIRSKMDSLGLSYDAAYEEVVADSMETILSTGNVVDMMAALKQHDKTLWQKIYDYFKNFAQRLKNIVNTYGNVRPDSAEGRLVADMRAVEAMNSVIATLEQLFAEGLVEASENFQNSTEAVDENTVQYQGRFYLSAEAEVFGREIEEWAEYGRPEGETFILGSTGDVLQGLGAIESDIYMQGDKINTILEQHPEMTLEEIKKVPQILENPILILKSRNVGRSTKANSRIVMFGTVKAQNGQPVLTVLDLRPSENHLIIDDMQKVTSAYTKDNDPISFVKRSEVLYADKKRTVGLLRSIGFQMPKDLLLNGYVGSISYSGTEVNITGVPFSEVFSDNGKKFSMRNTVEETADLVAIHNITEDKLAKAIELGGLPMPSIAVTKASIPHTNFGDISLIFSKGTIDPKANRKNTVYSADAWTPVFPQVEYEADPQVHRRIAKKLNELGNRVDELFKRDLRLVQTDFEGMLNRYGGEAGLIDYVLENYGLKAAYLEEQGHHVSAVTTQVEADKGYNVNNAEKYQRVMDAVNEHTPEGIGQLNLKDTRDKYGAELENAYPGITKSAIRMSSVFRQIQSYLRDSEGTPVYETVTDEKATKQAVDDAINQTNFESWVRELFSGIEKSKGIYNNKPLFTNSGNRRSFAQTHLEVTLDNIVKAMATQNGGSTKNVSGFNGVKTLRAATAEKFSSVEAMHTRESRLQNLTTEQFEEINDNLSHSLYNVISAIDKANGEKGNSNSLFRYDTIGEIITEICESGRYGLSDIQSTFGKYSMEVNDDIALELKQLIYDITQMPVNLFEAKPERAVGFEEVAAVLVPDDTNADLLSGIENAGMRVIKYERGNSNARIDALNSVEGIKFSERVSNVVRDYSYEALISKPDMPITTVEETGKISRAEVVSQAQKNAASVGYTNENGNAVVHVEDTGIDVLVSKHGLTHGLDRRLEVLAPVTLKIGEILKNSIRINELTPAKENVSGSYVLIGAAKNANGDFYVVRSVVNSYNNELSSVDVLYAIHTKKETAVLNEPAITENPLRITVSQEPAALLPRFTDKAASFSGSIKNQPGAYPQGSQSNDRFLSGSVISIAELLEYVNEYFPDILPESVLKHFGHDARPEGTLGESALFQDRSEELEKVNRVLEKENEKLKDDVSSLRELLKLQRSVTGGTKFKKSSVEAAANVLIKNTNAKGNKTELAPYLNTLYEYIAKNEDITWEGVMERADAAVKWLQDHITVKKKLDPHAALILRDLRNTRVYLDDVQKQEVSYRFDSYNNYRQKLMGSIILTDKASVSLDTKWQELSSKYPDFFDPNTNAADMPIALAEAILTLRDMDISNMDYAYDWEMAAQDLRMQVYDTYWNVSALYTVADAKQKEINKLKYHHAKRMSELRDTHKDNVKKLKIEYRRKIEDLRKAYRERSEKKQQQIIERYQESRERASENRKKTAMRNKIKGVVSELNQYLLRGTKDKHVPIELQKAVAEALDIINMDTVGAEERVAYYNELIQKHANDPDVVAELTASRDRIQAQGDKLHEKLAQLKSAYADIKESTDPLIANSYDEVIASTMDAVVKSVGNTPLRDMTLSQLEDVYDLYKMTLTVIRNANKAFKAAKRENIAVLGNRVMEEVDKFSKDSPYSVKLAEGIKTFDWNNLKPVYAFERIGSNTLTDLYNNVRTGEDTWAKDVSEAREFYLRTTEKYGFKSWDMDKLFSFKSRTGVEFSLSLEQIMSLYAYSKREQAGAHLERGGFVFDSNITVTKKTKLGIPLEYNVRTANAHNLSPEILGEIISKLTPQQKGFADEMQDYLSTVMGEKGNEISLEMYGVKLFKEKNYFPLKSARQFMFEQQEVAGEVKIKNSGFTKETVVNASNPIILSNFTDVWARHVNEMSMYHSFVLPLEDFNRVFNYKTPTSETLQSESVKTQLQNAYGTQPADYIKQLLTDLNGGAVSDPREHTAKRLLAKFKKASVFASLSVVIQQPSAIGRAFAEIDPKYFVGRRLDKKSHKYLWAQLKKYAPVATIKEMGYFDTNMGRSATDFIAGTEYHGIKEKAKALITDSNYRDEVISRAPALMDELTWCAIWDAAKRETKANNPKLDVRSEEFLTKAGQRFTEVVTKTQVYDSVLARSGNMRSKGVFMNMWTSFMAEPTTTINMLEDALVKLQRGDKKKAGKVIAAATTSVFFNSILVSLVYAMRDDDEDETFLEKYLSSFTTEILDGINPLTYIPLIKDIWSLLQGYDIERADMTLISRAIDSTTKIIGLIGKDTEDMSDEQFEKHQGNVKNALWDVVDDITSLFGLPVKNIRRDANGVINFIKTVGEDLSGRTTTWSSVIDNAWGSAKNTIPVVGWLPDKSKSDILYAAITSGDEAYAERLEGSYATESAYNSAVRKGLRENDARIFDAAVAKMAGDASEYLSIVKEIVGEGFFSQDNVVSAIKQEVSARTEKESSGTSKAVAIFTADDYFNAVINGDASDVNVVKNELIDESIAKGNTRNQAESSVESGFVTNVKEAYEDGDLGKAAAINYITQYGGKTKDEAEAEIKKVDFEIEYGFTWSEKDNAFRLGAISESELVIAYMDIEGKTKDEALAAVEKLHFTNDYGFDYSDIDDAFFDGKISQAEAKEMYITYGGMSEKDATEKVAVMEFVKQHPEVEGITYAAIESYTTYSEAYNVPIVTFYDAWKYKSSTKADVDANGEAISGSKKSKVLAYIDTLALTDAQKDSLYYAFGWALSTLHEAPWH